MKTVGVIGGDRRQAYLAELLSKDGFEVHTYGLDQWSHWETGLEQAASADVVLFPLPLCWREGVLHCAGEVLHTEKVFSLLKPEQLVLAGQVKQAQLQEAERVGIRVEDYFLREELTVANAAATAEGALQVAMEQLEHALLGTECLVLGFGRIGKLLSYRLHGLGARVTVSARSAKDLAWVDAFGWQGMELGEVGKELGRFSVVFNTIPSYIINKEQAARFSAGSLVIDLASVQGVDEGAVTAAGARYIWARGLPGKLLPMTAAKAIHRVVLAMLQEWEELH